ncbi:MAG TPA: UDP-N-acetylglucosamine 1-carboxyvinyltransferase [Caldisericia bacterium]|nr:UDP-N-acetylglucosamine 1-carboxyvinyltransferase [Caldisericia bacterium]HPF48247.1 UDP-N-acetylglucosamine 1-carboxyvinyltransferase [Caldisericia bacterium]HPI83817.1 UDP-N-acetylglucosamine 1-carboxyvinyltransferase [Caldisericia bacterium]HPQ92700.1 UDP-N-acetylglucosamine 1-carboxyvinyltransferase [Caldisericia bacterium]HRV74202.1 UDP-N-acetylglucosamine 1-carboxyvinyltransferase [Caldisericia bacterium]
MNYYEVRGGNKLSGRIGILGAKNAAMPIVTAAVMIPGEVTLHNMPTSSDPQTLIEMTRTLGVKVKKIDNNTYSLDSTADLKSEVTGERANRIRGSQTLLGALLARTGEVTLGKLGGCRIGERPMDLHLKGFKALGAIVEEDRGAIHCKAVGGLVGANIFLDFPSVGATENIMIAATTAKGETIIENAACEPEIEDLALFLRSCGAKIIGAGSKTIKVIGVSELKPTSHSILPDRIEAGTYMIAAAIAGGDVLVESINPTNVDSLIFKLQEIGVSVKVEGGDRVRIRSNKRVSSTNIRTLPYPGFPTDLQPQMTALLSTADGVSVVTETIFENRFSCVPDLVNMGAKIKSEGHSVVIDGVEKLHGTEVEALDLRGGSALILAGLSAEGTTTVAGAEHVERGFSDITGNLSSLGAEIKRVAR